MTAVEKMGLRNISLAIINQALISLRSRDEFEVQDALEYFNSEWYHLNILAVGKDVRRINRQVIQLVKNKVSDDEVVRLKASTRDFT